jgi:hypothetical protein
MLLSCLQLSAQRFFNLTSDQVTVDSVMPQFAYSVPLTGDFQDSTYTATLLYPEFIDMTVADIANYHKLSKEPLPALPEITTRRVLDRKRGALEVQFCPMVYREGKYRLLVSFMLRIDATQAARSKRMGPATRGSAERGRYADHSVLASGRWAKIRVPATGVYELTDALIRKAGFSHPDRVKLYGYGGNLQNETLVGSELQALDDLKEVATCTVKGHRLFHARGPVSWSSNTATRRTRNPYSDYGYYFLTESDGEPATTDSAAFVSSFYPSPEDYHSLYEVDGFSWYPGGRNLFDTEATALGKTRAVVMKNSNGATSARLAVNVSAGTNSKVEVMVNGTVLGQLTIQLDPEYDKGNERGAIYSLSTLHAADTVKIRCTEGGPIRLDYISMTYPQAAPEPRLSGSFAAPEYMYTITPQDHHADPEADMVIIIPTSQKLKAQAQRIADFHREHDGLRVNIVPADELYNEFASGTPDANAYRRYLKMLYDRAQDPADMPRYLLLMGDCVWDNRMLTADCHNLDPDDYLLCFESENSFNEIYCYVDDGFFCLLDDGEGSNPQRSDKLDMAVGRFPVTTDDEARGMVDKTIDYIRNTHAGAWQNTLMLMGDDGNANLHMRDLNDAAEDIQTRYPGYLVRKVMWDAYAQEKTSVGNSYPEVRSLIVQQQQAGALIMDYAGHGRADQISHEAVLKLKDFEGFTNQNLPLWITASCDIMPFDGVVPTIGEAAVLNARGGAVAFFGTTRTVYANYNKLINMSYLRHVLSHADGKAVTVGEAQRLAKNEMITTRGDLTTNKLQYSLLGDPALALQLPSREMVIDTINGIALSSGQTLTLRAGSVAHVAGHVEGGTDFSGVMTAVVRDARQLVTCRMNTSAETEEAFTYYDRTNVLYHGTDSVRGGKFNFSFAVPMDIHYTDDNGLMNLSAVSRDHSTAANGSTDAFLVGGSTETGTDSVGPKVYCYLNTPEFENGGRVNTTPYFVAQIHDDDGINATGSGIGHDLQLIIDGDASKTYTLNDNFVYDFGSYTQGSTSYSIPELEPGRHRLTFRAWDMRNNCSTSTLDFTAVKGLTPSIYSIGVSENPARSTTTFIVSHDMNGSEVGVTIDVFDTAGRLLWTYNAKGISTGSAYTVTWDLTDTNGNRLPSGVYLYRVRMTSDGSSEASKAKKLIVLNNN